MEFNGKTISIVNPDIVGNALEELFFPFYCEVCPDFKQGPPQNPPDFYALDNEFQFEQKCFGKSPGFDISSFGGFINQISEPGALIKKIFKTKYLVYKYEIKDNEFTITNFWMLNIWNLPVYNKKYPISVQVKHGVYCNIRPGTACSWSDETKTAELFIKNLIVCINDSKQLPNKEALIESISKQVEEAKTLGFL